MPRRKLFLVTTLGAIVLAVALTVLGFFVKHEPNFYRQTQLPAGEVKKQIGLECSRKFVQMVLDKNAKKEDWGCEVSEAELNSFLSEVFPDKGESEGLGKLGISAPSVVLEDKNHLRIAFRYDTGWFSTIISYELKIWLVQKDPNVIAVEFQAPGPAPCRSPARPSCSSSASLAASSITRSTSSATSAIRWPSFSCSQARFIRAGS